MIIRHSKLLHSYCSAAPYRQFVRGTWARHCSVDHQWHHQASTFWGWHPPGSTPRSGTASPAYCPFLGGLVWRAGWLEACCPWCSFRAGRRNGNILWAPNCRQLPMGMIIFSFVKFDQWNLMACPEPKLHLAFLCCSPSYYRWIGRSWSEPSQRRPCCSCWSHMIRLKRKYGGGLALDQNWHDSFEWSLLVMYQSIYLLYSSFNIFSYISLWQII